MRPGVGVMILGCLAISAARAAEHGNSSRTFAEIWSSYAPSATEDDRSITIEWACPGVDEEVTFCIVGSMRMYWDAFDAIRNKKLKLGGRQFNFITRMHRHSREGKDENIALMVASWDGAQLAGIDWGSANIGSIIDQVKWVQADQQFPTSWALGEVCNSLYGDWPRLCALAKASARH